MLAQGSSDRSGSRSWGGWRPRTWSGPPPSTWGWSLLRPHLPSGSQRMGGLGNFLSPPRKRLGALQPQMNNLPPSQVHRREQGPAGGLGRQAPCCSGL